MKDVLNLYPSVISRSFEDFIKEFCRRYPIRRLALFGSILREDFGPNSDIDILVTFEPGATPGFGFIGIQDELSDMLGHQVDLHTPASLNCCP